MTLKLTEKLFHSGGKSPASLFSVLLLLAFSILCYGIHILLCPFPKRDALTYLHILHYWNTTGSFTQMLDKFPKFGLLLFSFLPLKWAEQAGIPLYPASIVWMTLMSTVSVYTFYKIVLLLTGNVKNAVWCGALLAVHPIILLYAGNLLRDTPYLMFSLLLVLLFIHAVRNRKWYFFCLSGITLAMCVLSRFEALELLVLFPVFLLFYAVRKKWTKRETVSCFLWTAAGFFCMILLMLSAIDDLTMLYEKGKIMFLSFFPDWMGLR